MHVICRRVKPEVNAELRRLCQRRGRANRVIAELIEAGLEGAGAGEETFSDLANRPARSSDVSEQRRLKEELARMTFAESCRRSSGRICHDPSGTICSIGSAIARPRWRISTSSSCVVRSKLSLGGENRL